MTVTPLPDTPAWGVGLATMDAHGIVLDTWFPARKLGLGAPPWAGTPAERYLDETLSGEQAVAGFDELRNVRTVWITVVIESLAKPPANTSDAYLRLHLLSNRLVRPHGLSLEGIFGQLPNVAWTSAGPCPADELDGVRFRARRGGGSLTVHGVDKFPRMLDYVTPSGVRIADASRVRLGAHLAPGTTVMHEGFVNFNAGTLGASMVEGRIAAGVVVGDHSDIGGGASIMGTLSGGGSEVVRIGERCLLGANSGVGISLGDDSVVEAGCYITAGSKVTVRGSVNAHDTSHAAGTVLKARQLSGVPGLQFWRNSTTGTLEVLAREANWGELNAELHTAQ